MASIELDKRSKRYRIRFRIEGQEFKRSIRTRSHKEANTILSRVEDTLSLIQRGRIVVPVDADIAKFVLSDGKAESNKTKSTKLRSIKELFQNYEETWELGFKEASTIKTERIHLGHLKRILKTSLPVVSFSANDVQSYVNNRLKEKHGDGLIAAETAKKEIATFRTIWNWAFQLEQISKPWPIKHVQYPKRNEKPPFMTWVEIERRIARGGLTAAEEKELWAGLFLTTQEITECLRFVEDNALEAFVHPMILFAAHTGARLSEILRSEIDDFDFVSKSIRIREKKRSRTKAVTFRHVPMTADIVAVFTEWFSKHPGGKASIAMNDGSALDGDDARYYFKRVFRIAKWKRLRGFHVFRHSFISNAAASDVDQRVIDSWVGHTTEEMRNRYRHLFPDQQRTEIQKIFAAA